ncbi:extracellular solute-binding protein [Candidatus Purcelliella pentastirinorum]|uniref:extracellular solute-binding protein n=1 Tax=Candidatus Purcelliella pentastirinorum TaxID=472834 RepID=UPI0023678AB0|nr:extracellular solute-binding protein [Candidatus Purcelliella pentastirinorum]WDI78774.1 extracellular solute-binding protein [Candidatus Purcelliella pentastirinorum]WDR79908.1 extracellular solute-binding protein [Candidatus Purcelliella pentastirinorum]
MNKLLFIIILIISLITNCKEIKKNTLYFYNWSEYVPTEILEQFTKESGIKVIYSTYDSNEDMYIKLKTYKKIPYDLIVPSTYFVAKMKNEGMLKKINKKKIPNLYFIDKNLLNKPFDPQNKYSIPYIWGATAIGINSDKIDYKKITSWKDLWKKEYKNSILLINDAREVFHMALLKLGYSGNTTNKKKIQEAYKTLKILMPNVLTFNSDNPSNPFIEGDINIGMIWNGSAYTAKLAHVPLKLIWPKEGSILWMDNLSIPINAKNIEGALKMINFLLRPDISAKIAISTGYLTPNIEAKKILPKTMSNNKFLYPSNKMINKGEWQNDVGDISNLYEQLFQKLKMTSY